MSCDHIRNNAVFKLLGTSGWLINSRAAMRSIRDQGTNRDLNLAVAGASRETSSLKVIVNLVAFPVIFHFLDV